MCVCVCVRERERERIKAAVDSVAAGQKRGVLSTQYSHMENRRSRSPSAFRQTPVPRVPLHHHLGHFRVSALA